VQDLAIYPSFFSPELFHFSLYLTLAAFFSLEQLTSRSTKNLSSASKPESTSQHHCQKPKLVPHPSQKNLNTLRKAKTYKVSQHHFITTMASEPPKKLSTDPKARAYFDDTLAKFRQSKPQMQPDKKPPSEAAIDGIDHGDMEWELVAAPITSGKASDGTKLVVQGTTTPNKGMAQQKQLDADAVTESGWEIVSIGSASPKGLEAENVG
jgi:hypothetical protein